MQKSKANYNHLQTDTIQREKSQLSFSGGS